MNRLWSGAGAAIFLAVRIENARVVVPGNQPVTIDQVKQKLEADGWWNIPIAQRDDLSERS
jgi:hypothetical protein